MLYGEDPYSGPGKHSNRKLKHMPFMAHYKSASCHRLRQFRLQLMPMLVHYTASCTCRERLPFIRLPCVTYTVPCLCCSLPHKSTQHSHYTIYIVVTHTVHNAHQLTLMSPTHTWHAWQGSMSVKFCHLATCKYPWSSTVH